MRAKRLDIRALFVAGGLIVAAPVAVSAQLSGGQWRLPAGGSAGGTQAVEAKPQPQVIVVQPQAYPQTVFRRHPSAYNPYGPLTYTLVPAVVLADGRVFADFGYGYQPVYRSCAGAVVVGQPMTVVAGNGVVLNPPAPTYTQPVPNQQTASQQMSSANRTNNVVMTGAAQYSCYSRDPYGRVLVYRF